MSTPVTVTESLMINVQIDGEWKQFPKGTRLIEACMQSGQYIPHYCYHPKLSVPGNCRMCLIELGSPRLGADRKPEIGADGHPLINWSPRPAISCALEISEGMAVRTNSPLVEECRKGVMEFLLINHPLDCPICDKAGECRLQEFSVEYGQGGSEFHEEKVKKPKHVDIGKHIVLDDERCILCSRCIRFMQEIAHDDVLGFVDRGSHTTLTVHPEKRLDNNYSLNTVDICPVGALTSKDFRFKMRVWFLKETKTIDVNCGTGCNIIISSREDIIQRITPRQNEEVNSYWMPDSHRLNYTYLHRADRLTKPQLKHHNIRTNASWNEAVTTAATSLQQEQPGSIALIASGRMTNEELFLTRRLAQALSIELVDIRPRPQEGDDFLIAKDGNPNTRGAQLLGLTGKEPGAYLPEIASGIASGKITSLICLHENAVACGIAPEDLAKLKNLIVLDILPNETTRLASIVFPGSGAAEKRGSMINIKGRLQRLNQAINPPGDARSDWEILRNLLQILLRTSVPQTIEELFQEMAAETPALQGLNLSKIGDVGVQILSPSEKGSEPNERTAKA
ncbi:MAG: NADH dehydrogenase [Verrucomicrobia bacterium RIFCSPHIGHO2_12_FULL_41_10]|nr:MAG: NADH dehydrogenase [Verrucomicrobia bacterium RIFCSPHIGHO2_12_FULL_41_10]HLB33070.1 molybdopterin-dependent oxidoreductase [Chthoniobacterales bacterium]